MFNKQFMILCCLISTAPAWAISNIESQNPGQPEEGLEGTIKVGLTGKTGDSREKDYQGSSKITWRFNDDVFLGLIERNYGTTRDIKDTDDAFAHGRWTHLLSDTWAVEGFGQWEEDEFSNLESRVLLGGGGRYVVAQEEDVYSFSLGLGVFREREKLDLQTYNETNYAWRANTFYAYKHQLNPQVFIVSTAYFQPNIDDWDDIRALVNLGLSVKLTETLNLQVDYKITHDSQPAQNLNAEPPIDNYKTNSEYSTSLVYKF